jgi:hypothetical protein
MREKSAIPRPKCPKWFTIAEGGRYFFFEKFENNGALNEVDNKVNNEGEWIHKGVQK